MTIRFVSFLLTALPIPSVGVQSLPRVISLAADGSLRMAPVEELQALRRASRPIPRRKLPDGAPARLDVTAGPSAELSLEIAVNAARAVGVKVLCDEKTGEETTIRYEPARKTLVLDVSRSTRRKDVKYSAGPLDGYGAEHAPRTTIEVPLNLPAGEPLRLHVFVDGPVLEVFANGRQCITAQVFPASVAASGVSVYAEGGGAELLGGNCWELAPATFVDQKRP